MEKQEIINSLWHDAYKETPRSGVRIVNEDWYDFILDDEKDYFRILKKYKFQKWAYVDDLLPENYKIND